jgi:tryptophan-rich sensory protein
MSPLYATKLTGARWIAVATAALPPVVIFGLGSIFLKPGNNNGANVKGRPPGWFFGFIWFVIVVLWGFSNLTSGYVLENNSFIVYTVLTFMSVIMTALWLGFNSRDSSDQRCVWVLGALVGFTLGMIIISTTATTKDGILALGLPLTVLFTWSTLALLLNLFSINLPN